MIRSLSTIGFPSVLSRSITKPFSARLCSSSPARKPPSIRSPSTPLFLREPTHSVQLSDVRSWHDWAKTLASSVGSSFADEDDGPDSSLLIRELKWLIEDAIEDPSLIHQHETQAVKDLRLRVALEELYDLWRRRIEERRPFQYIVGCEHWRDLVLCVEEGVLIPRPETELIVDVVEDLVMRGELFKEGLWADLGTGSGAIAIGIARVLGYRGRVIASDLSPQALAVAQVNVQRYDLQEKVELRQGSWFEPLKDVQGQLAGLVSNPPYIPSEDIPRLQAEVRRHEPRLALDGGIDGIDSLLELCDGAAHMLKPNGFLALETNGEKQSEFLRDYMVDHSAGRFQRDHSFRFCRRQTVRDWIPWMRNRASMEMDPAIPDGQYQMHPVFISTASK